MGEEDFIKKNILKASDMQILLEKFIVGKYHEELFTGKNLDELSQKLKWDRQTVLAYFTKVLAQKRYTALYHNHEGIHPAQHDNAAFLLNAMEKLRKNPERYLKEMNKEPVFDGGAPDLSIMEDN